MPTDDTATPLKPLTHIGRYEVVTRLGAGGMARVHLAVQRGPFGVAKLVVIKQLRPELADDPEFVSLFVDEARIAMRLNHPNVVETYEVVADPGYFLVMEFLEGYSLYEILRRVGRAEMPLEEHLWILTQMLAGLHYAHQLQDFDGTPLGIVHRDVSPSNVFVTYAGEVKLLDFGIAKATSALSNTKEGVVKGKVGYAAPEQLVGNPVDARTDVYAVGVMLWEAMARRRRASGDTHLAMLQARIFGGESPIDQVWPDAPPSLVKICRRALSTAPNGRYATALELERELQTYLSSAERQVGPQQLAALLSPYFQKDSAALRRNIATSIAAAAREALTEPSLRALAPSDEMENAQPMHQLQRRATPWLGAAAALVLAFLLGKTLHRAPEPTLPTRNPPMSMTPVLPAPPAPTVVAPAAPPVNASMAPSAVPVSGPPAVDSTAAPTAGARPRSAPPRKRRDETKPQPTEKQGTSRAEVAAEAAPPERRAEPAEPWEPGIDLRQVGTVRRQPSIDDKDPYTP